MLNQALSALLVRELRAVQRELDLYPSESSVWQAIPGVPNTGGTLALHVAGNLQHFIGARWGGSGYVRDRDAEFARRDVPRAELKAELDAAIDAVQRTFAALSEDAFSAAFPEPIAKRTVQGAAFGLHLLAHLAYHLGQLDIHRRAVTADAAGAEAVSVRELPEMR